MKKLNSCESIRFKDKSYIQKTFIGHTFICTTKDYVIKIVKITDKINDITIQY